MAVRVGPIWLRYPRVVALRYYGDPGIPASILPVWDQEPMFQGRKTAVRGLLNDWVTSPHFPSVGGLRLS